MTVFREKGIQILLVSVQVSINPNCIAVSMLFEHFLNRGSIQALFTKPPSTPLKEKISVYYRANMFFIYS